MSKLDLIVLDCVNKALDGNEERLGDYIDPTKREIKDLMLELIHNIDNPYKDDDRVGQMLSRVARKVKEL